jgi:hypothetical protein
VVSKMTICDKGAQHRLIESIRRSASACGWFFRPAS